MTRVDSNEERNERIRDRILVDAYSSEEAAMGWAAYLDDILEFPFHARCVTERAESPLKEDETIRVIGMPSTDPTLTQMFVTIEWMDRELGVPLTQLEAIDASDATDQAIADWQYWLNR